MAEPDVKQKLAAILAADVAGYTRLMGDDEHATVATVREYREVFRHHIERNDGRVVDMAGDSVLAVFSSTAGAVAAATATQKELTKCNDALAPERQMRFRIGINLGDIHEADDGTVYGDGVNVAARLEGLAEPGGVTLSEDAWRQMRRRSEFTFADAGTHLVKNIAEPIHVWSWQAQAIGGAPGSLVDATAKVTDLQDRPAIAVLPFANMSADPEQEYFSDGLTEDIITALTQWRSFHVIARNSSFAYKNKAVDIKQSGRELGARYLLEGSVRKGGARVRITAQLIDGADGHHLWAQKYDRELNDIFEVQDEIVQRIAALVAPEMARAELARSNVKQPVDLDAWDLCLRGMASIHEQTAEGNAKAREAFNRAIASRPGYADAFTGLAMSYNQDILVEATEDRTETGTLAMDAARRAINCDETSAWAHHELSTAYQWLNRLDDALDEARIAANLNPNDAYTLHALGNKSDLAGDPHGIAFMEKAQMLNPADARLPTHLTFLARAYVNVGNHDAALERARQAIRRRPDYAPAHYMIAIALGHLGESEAARAALAKCEEIHKGFVQSRRNWRPYANAANNQRLRAGLEELGLLSPGT